MWFQLGEYKAVEQQEEPKVHVVFSDFASKNSVDQNCTAFWNHCAQIWIKILTCYRNCYRTLERTCTMTCMKEHFLKFLQVGSSLTICAECTQKSSSQRNQVLGMDEIVYQPCGLQDVGKRSRKDDTFEKELHSNITCDVNFLFYIWNVLGPYM